MPKGKYKRTWNILKICLICKKEFLACKQNTKYCSLKCSRKSVERTEKRKLYRRNYAREWRKRNYLRWRLISTKSIFGENGIKAYKRDNFTCQRCGEKNMKLLELNHMDLDKTNNSLGNLIVLCHKCNNSHYNFIIKQLIKKTPKDDIIALGESFIKDSLN